MTLVNPEVNAGTAQWQDLRDPSFGEPEPVGTTEIAGRPGADEPPVAGELRTIVADYNTVLADEAFADLTPFFVTSQIDAVEGLVRVLPQAVAKLAALNAALSEPNAALTTAVEMLKPANLLRVDLGPISLDSETTASAELTNVGGVEPLRFVIEDGEWYLEHPVVKTVGPALGQLEMGLSTLDETIAGLEAGTLSEVDVAEKIDATRAMIAAFWQLAVEPAPEPEGGDDAGAETDDETVGT